MTICLSGSRREQRRPVPVGRQVTFLPVETLLCLDTGLLTVNGGLRIHVARSLADAVQADPLVRQYYGQPPLLRALLLPAGAQPPARKYLDWHREKIFAA